MLSVVGEGPGDLVDGQHSGESGRTRSVHDPQALRVAIVAPNCSLSMGGEAALPYHYFRLLRARQIDVHLVGHHRNREELLQAFPEDQDRIHLVPDGLFQWVLYRIGWPLPTGLYRATFGGSLQVITQAEQRRILRQLVRTRGITMVHQPAPVSPAEPSMIFGVGAPVMIGPMNGGLDYPPAFRDRENPWERISVRLGRRLRHVMNLLIPGKRRAALLLVSNRRTREVLPATRVPVVELVENGVDLSLWPPRDDQRSPDRSDGGGRFVYLGRLVDWKGVDLLLRAWAEARISPAARLEIIGDGPMCEQLVALRDRLGLAASVEFVGYLTQPECSRRLRQADVLILPSLMESGGAVVLEAMATGLAVIATDRGGPADYLDESCGILVPPTSRDGFIRGLAGAIERLDSSPELRFKMGRAALRRVAAFSWEAKIDRILEIYRQVVRLEGEVAPDAGGRNSYTVDPSLCRRMGEA
jgi:glycosyltransferase involved in cell wall biosynthesis